MHVTIRAALLTAALGLASSFAAQAQASTATDALSACLVKSTTQEDHIALARWIFAAMASHPRVADLSSITPDQRAEINKTGGLLFNRLLTKDCAAETTAAVRADGKNAIEVAFGGLGGAAMEDLMTDPAVNQSLGEMMQYVDENKLFNVLVGAPAK